MLKEKFKKQWTRLLMKILSLGEEQLVQRGFYKEI